MTILKVIFEAMVNFMISKLLPRKQHFLQLQIEAFVVALKIPT